MPSPITSVRTVPTRVRSRRRLLGATGAAVVTMTLLATGAALAASTPSPGGTADTGDVGAETQKLMLILDVSGSMAEPDASGTTKMKAAQAALTSVVESLPPTTQVGLRVYGAEEVGGEPTEAACADTQLVHPLAPLDRDRLASLINSYEPKGETPLGFSLTEAMTDLGTDGERNVIAMSDGKESCTPDPCPAMRDLIGAGINLRLDTVGVAVDAEARAQLVCLADAGHGKYYDVEQTNELVDDLRARLAPPAVASPSPTPSPTPPAAEEPSDTSLLPVVVGSVSAVLLAGLGWGLYAARSRRRAGSTSGG